jgi:peptidoglycan-associated lipoprotein
MIRIFNLIIFLILFGVATGCSKNLMPPEIQGDSILEENVGRLGSSTHDFVPNITEDKASNISKNFEQEDKAPFSDLPFEENPREYGTCGGDCMVLPYNYPQEEARMNLFKDTSLLQDVHFKFDRYDLDEESRSTLRKNASYLKSNSSAIIEIQGHCDERGTNNYNIALGERRSHSTKMYLVSQGVGARRIHTISYGEEKPFCFDSKEECLFKNRRAHFRISE